MPHKHMLHMLSVLWMCRTLSGAPLCPSRQLHARDTQYHLLSLLAFNSFCASRCGKDTVLTLCSGTTTVWASRGTRLLLLTCMCIVLLLMLLSKRTSRRLCIRVTCHSRVTHVPHVPSSRLSRPPWRPIHHRLHVRAISMCYMPAQHLSLESRSTSAHVLRQV